MVDQVVRQNVLEFHLSQSLMCRISSVNKLASKVNTYDNSSASMDEPACINPHAHNPANTAARRAIPPPNDHQNVCAERPRAHKSQATLVVEASHAAAAPMRAPTTTVRSFQINPPTATSTAVNTAPSTAARAAV